MNKTAIAVLLVATLFLPCQLARAGDRMYKCTTKGSVAYQSTPCPSESPRERPTVEQLNAERQKKLQEAKDNPPPASGTGAISTSAPTQSPSATKDLPSSTSRHSFVCDGRTHCSQMTSCAEAKYFLANCPNVKMDGDHNGIPCERQWCN